jgi:lysosomal acid lipase/cholesteryl ester hydrolase
MNPPLYDVSKVLTPVALISSTNDWLATPDDVEYLRKNLPNIVFDRCLEKLDHLDFIWGLDASTLIYPNVIDLLEKFA